MYKNTITILISLEDHHGVALIPGKQVKLRSYSVAFALLSLANKVSVVAPCLK